MRIPSSIIFERINRGLQENLQRLYDEHEKLSSGKRINKPSDDVIEISKVQGYKVNINKNAQFLRNIDDATAFLEFTETTLDSVSESLMRLKELALVGVNGDENSESRRALAQEVSKIKNGLLNHSKSKLRDRYIFSGHKTDRPAFDNTFNYQGDAGKIEINVDRHSQVIENITGKEAFVYSLTSPKTINRNDGSSIHYTPGIDTEITVEIWDANSNIIDSFTFKNFMEMTEILEDALNNENLDRIEALLTPLDDAMSQVLNVRTEVGARLNFLSGERENNEDSTLSLKTILSRTEDTDIVETISELAKTDAALQSLRNTSSRIINNSLFDYLK
jgi:flagellar hook-associated protein 3 FlgL